MTFIKPSVQTIEICSLLCRAASSSFRSLNVAHMPPKKKNPRKRSRPDDDNSTGVGADDQQVQATNPRTGRPIRRSAGRVFQGFTNTLDAVSDDELSGPEYDPENPPSHAAKKQRTPSPPLDDGILDVESDAGLSDVSIGADYGATLSPSYTDVDGDLRNVSLTFNVPRGHSGPLVVKLDLNNLLHGTHQRRSDRRSSSKTLVAAASPIIKKSSSPVPQSRKGFLDLPAEIRNQIYALVFVEETSFNFDYPKNFAHCAALLRTCKQVNLEGCTVLYSENLFYFRRNTTRRVKHWYTSGNSSEIGFRDVHYFLSSIGPTNISYLRDVVFVLDDVTPSSNPYLKTAWDRRYVNDEPLIACLKLLAAHGRLRTIKLVSTIFSSDGITSD